MSQTPNAFKPTVHDKLRSAAQDVVAVVRRNTPHPFLLYAKLGDANTRPMPDTEIASAHDISLSTISNRWSHVINVLSETNGQHGNPLDQIAQRTNDVMAKAAIINRHSRRPPLYSETTMKTLVELGFATPQHLPRMRAAGYVTPPLIVPRSHDVDPIITDIAAHMVRSNEPQSVARILQSLEGHQVALENWPDLDLTLFIHRIADIRPDDHGLYYPDQPWGKFISLQRLVANTILRIFTRDQQPRNTEYLVSEIERLVGHLLPDG